MSRQFLTGVVAVIVAAVCISVPECYGWEPPLYIDSDWKVYAPVGVWAIVDAWVESGGPVYLPWSWNWESGGYQDQYDEEYSSMSWGQYSSSGIYDVYVYASSAGGSDDAHSYVYAVAVTQVVSSTSAACVGQNVTFGALTNPPNCASYVTVTWSGGQNPATGSGSQWTTNWTTPGPKTVIATCGSSSAQKNVTVVKVDKLQYNDPDTGYTDVSGTMYVHKGTAVTFKAIPDPCNASWPSGKPIWGGTAGASGTGETKAVAFNTLSSTLSDYKTVTAECGNTVSANVIVYDFEGELTPDDNFDPNRSYDEYGIEETVKLECSIVPNGLTGGTVGGLKWSRIGVGGVSNENTSNGTSDYDAQETSAQVMLRLTVQSGPSKDDFRNYTRSVIAPSGGYMIQKPGTGIRHTVNTCSAGFLGISYITPNNVSFTNLQTREGYCTATASGFYAYKNGQVHPAGGWNGVTDGNINTGCKEDYPEDEIWSGQPGPPYSIGDFVWPIPVEYKADDGVVHTLTSNQNHHEQADTSGKCTISKYGTGPFSKNASDPSSSW